MKLIYLLLCGLLFTHLNAQEGYRASLDINNIRKDQIEVEMTTPSVKEEVAVYVIPKVIPGSYSTKDFGRFISDFKAYSKKGKKLKVDQLDLNRYRIYGATELGRVEYTVDDTWDAEDENYIFQPGGTHILEGENVVINHQGFWGYLENYKMLPYTLVIDRPEEFYGATALPVERGEDQDIIRAESYVKLVDNPVLYSRPDTTSFKVGQTRIHVALYSENKLIQSDKVAEILKPLAVGLDSFFGGMPVSDYHFLMYFTDGNNPEITGKGGFGALEHSYSSFYFLPEITNESRLTSMINSISAHEFLHILTPLNLHSEEIEFFDFIDPKMSQHLWLYEGVTEYFAMLLQWQQGLTSESDFFEEVQDKILSASEYPDVSFTEMSRNILSDEYKDAYQNVYYKGALIGFLLDLRLRELSNGESGLVDLMQELSSRYGPSKPFVDSLLIDEIVAATYPEIGEFFESYVIGNKPLPLEEYMPKIGYRYFDERTDSLKTFGNLTFAVNEEEKQVLVIESPKGQNVFGLENGDIIRSVNSVLINMENYEDALMPVIKPGDEGVVLTMIRDEEMYQIESEPVIVPVSLQYVLEQDPQAESPQLKLRESLIE